MQLKPVVSLLLLAFLSLPRAVSQTGAPAVPTAPPTAAANALDYSKESFVIQKYATDVAYQADGTGERLVTVQVKIQSDTAVRQFGVIAFPYESRNEHLDFVYVRVRKPDGTVIATPDTDAQDQPAEVTRQAPFYSDIRNKQLPVKSLAVGDQLEYQVREVRTVAAAPGHFWYVQNFLKDAVVLEETASLTVPKQKYVQVESPDVKPQITETGDLKIYRWKTAQPEKTKVPDEKAKKPVIVEQPPSIAVTTFKSWEEVGRWYGDLQKDRVGVTPPIQAKSNELVKGAITDEEKIAAIYTYVSTQYRYIGVAFGIGRFQPHSADDVMQNQYGDCKDKHTLLASLLKAAGYDAWPVLVGSQHVLQPDVPSPGQFDHVITAVTLNKSVLWMDSTPEVAPFRMLFSGLRDKLVLGIPNNSTPVLMKTPPNPPFDSLNKYEGKATLASDGTLTAHFDVSLRGDTELLFRLGFHQTPRVQWQTLVQNVSYSSGFAGTVSNIDASIPEQLAKPFQYSYDYTRKDFADWPNRRIVSLIPLVAFPYGEDDAKPVDTILLGGPVTYTFHSTIQLPQGYTAELPPNAKQQTDFAEYSSTYSQANGSFLVDRTFTFKQREIPASRWDDYLKFEKAVTEEAAGFIQLIGSGVQVKASQEAGNPDAAKLIRQAFADIGRRNFDVAKQELDQAAKLSPNERELWGGYGYLDISQNRVDEGIKKYQKELSLHPDRFDMYRYLAGVQEHHNHPEDAVQTLRALLKAAPDDSKGHAQLSALLIRQRRFAEAIPVLAEAVAQSPNNEGLKAELGNAELQGGARDKGAALLREVLTDSTDKDVLNDAAYALAEANLELPLARTSCEKALRLFDEATAKTTLSVLTDGDLRYVTHMAATWDTMAWILYRQEEFSKAEEFAHAAWMLDPGPTIGLHLGQIYEKQGKKGEAMRTYRLAVASSIAAGMPGVEDARQRLIALKGSSDATTDEESKSLEELNALRTVSVSSSKDNRGAADFFVLFSPGPRIEDVQFLNGDESSKSVADLLKHTAFDVPFPPGSGARIVRRGTFYCSEIPKKCQFTMRPPEATKRN
jgi:tetratricopeptide (TPR) repeat protein/transglutaminase-like putative cysteine protease